MKEAFTKYTFELDSQTFCLRKRDLMFHNSLYIGFLIFPTDEYLISIFYGSFKVYSISSQRLMASTIYKLLQIKFCMKNT